jgi:hypothetical protein
MRCEGPDLLDWDMLTDPGNAKAGLDRTSPHLDERRPKAAIRSDFAVAAG